MKRLIVFTVICLSILLLSCTPAFAADEDDSCKFSFDLTINGSSNAAAVDVGDEITVQLSLTRTDASAAYFAGAISDFIQYDGTLLELVEGSVVMPDSRFKYGGSVPASNGNRLLQFSAYSNAADGSEFPASLVLATFKFRAQAGGTATLEHTFYFVDNPRAVPYMIEKAPELKVSITGDKPPINTKYNISVTNPSQGGTITTNPSGSAAEGATVSLSIANIHAGYELGSWDVRGNGQSVAVTNSSFTMPAANVTVTAVLTPRTGNYTITVTNPTGGTITSPANGIAVAAGETVNLRIIPASGYTFTRWNVTSGGNAVTLSSDATTQNNSFAMPAGNVAVTAVLTSPTGNYSITVTNPTGGTITSPANGIAVAAGETVNLRITPASGYTFTRWNVTSGGNTVTLSSDATTQSNSFVMPAANVTVTASLSGSSGTTGGGGGGDGGGGGGISGSGTGTRPSLQEILDPETPLGDLGFLDVPESHWAYQYIMYLAQKGFVTGKTATSFAPSDPITRAEFVTILARMSGETLPVSYNGPFTDVVSGAYYEGAVAWGVNAGIVRGTSDTTFSPNNRILRQEIATMIVRYAAYKNFNFLKFNEPTDFTDSATIHDYAKEPVNVMQQADVINGYNDGTFRPLNNATRAEAAKMLALLHHLMND